MNAPLTAKTIQAAMPAGLPHHGRKATEWGMAENDAAVDPFLDGLPD
jgi:hypothetical protein